MGGLRSMENRGKISHCGQALDQSCHTVAVRRRSFYPLNYGGGKRGILGAGPPKAHQQPDKYQVVSFGDARALG